VYLLKPGAQAADFNLVVNEVPESNDVVAWNKARIRHRLELASAIVAGLFITAMFAVFARILTS
jgi:hypothetical protein